MNIHTVQYVIRDEGFPMFEEIRKLNDDRAKYFDEDPAREKEKIRYMAQACHTKAKFHDYWLDMIEEEFDKITVDIYSQATWSGDSIMIVSSDTLLAEEEQRKLLSFMRSSAEALMSIKVLKFNFNHTPAYEMAKEMGGIDVFEDWLYGNVFSQTSEALNQLYDEPALVGEGIYEMSFTKDVNQKNARKYIHSFVEEHMPEWLEQDVPKIRRTEKSRKRGE